MDALDNLLPRFRVRQAVYTRVEGRAPWGLNLFAYLHTKFGIVTEGCCYVDLKDGTPPVRLNRGSCYLLPRGDAYRLRDSADGGADAFEQAMAHIEGRTLRWGGDGARTTVIGGCFIFADEGYPLVLDLLPQLVHFKVSEQELSALESTMRLLENEVVQPSPGSLAMLNRLADIFFIQTLRAYLLNGNARETGWVGALSDEKLGAAIRMIHTRTDFPWTVEALAGHAGMSRAVFAARFKDKLGLSPIGYLTRHRLTQAQDMLLHTSMSIAQVAAKVGYESESAFNKAFKRELGAPPAAWRMQAQARTTAR
jgi:AraC-like DNA-binding protein